MTREEQLAREIVDLVDRFHRRRPHDGKHTSGRHLLRAAVPPAVNALALMALVRGLRSRRRGLVPLSLAYLEHRKRRSRRRKHR